MEAQVKRACICQVLLKYKWQNIRNMSHDEKFNRNSFMNNFDPHVKLLAGHAALIAGASSVKYWAGVKFVRQL